MSKKIRMKFIKTKDMIYISHLDVQRLLQRVFRRADIELSFSQGFNPHPKITYGNALALGVESYGEYVDIEIEADLAIEVLKERLNAQLPDGMAFVKLVELVGGERNLASSIEYGDYEFTVENAYAADGQTLDYTADPNDSRNSSNKSWTDKASDVVNDVKDQASSLWDKISDSLSGLFR